MALANLSPVVAIHLCFALSALALGPVALIARKGSRPHRASGYIWVAMMLGAAISSAFIRDFRLPNLAGFTPIHILTVVTLVSVSTGVYYVVQRNIRAHRRTMWMAYLGGCIGAGIFALMPHRLLGQLVWHHALGVI